ncbi:hypothetical protein LXL04_033908 [Taraxacum kok-saghyz]
MLVAKKKFMELGHSFNEFDTPRNAKKVVEHYSICRKLLQELRAVQLANINIATLSYDHQEQMKNYKPLEDETDVVDPYMVVMNKENDGYRRLYGGDVTNRLKRTMTKRFKRTKKKAELEAMPIDINNQ